MITIYDIAKECGCSPATVSKVFNNTGNISAQKRREILAAAERMGYVPNVAARSLVNSKSNMVGILLFVDRALGLRHELFAEILNAFRIRMENCGYEVLLISEEAKLWQGDLLRHCKAMRLDGVFCLSCDYDSPAVKKLIDGGIPVVGFEVPYENVSCVESKNYESAKKLTEYFLSLGHKRIAFVSGTDTFITRERIRGYRDALMQAGLPPDDLLQRCGYFSKDEGAIATRLLMSCGKKCTAALYPDDFTAIAGMRELKKYGISVPDDLSIAGFDGVSLGRMVTPQLTTVVQDAQKIGKVAADMLLDKIEGRETEPRTVRLDTELFIGESSIPFSKTKE